MAISTMVYGTAYQDWGAQSLVWNTLANNLEGPKEVCCGNPRMTVDREVYSVESTMKIEPGLSSYDGTCERPNVISIELACVHIRSDDNLSRAISTQCE
jgi:hypothetical protein